MKKLFVLILSLCLLTSCGNKKSEITINDKEYKLNDTIYVNLTLDTKDSNVNVCPKIKISKDDEGDPNNLTKYLDYNLDNLSGESYTINR